MTEHSGTEQPVDEQTTDPMDWVRVRDLDTGHTLSLRRITVPHGNFEVLDAPAVDSISEEPLPPEYNPSAPSVDQVVVDYDQLLIEDLKAEVARRNEGRLDSDSLIAVGGRGNKPDLIAALQGDDQAQAAAAAAISTPGQTPDGEPPVDNSGGQ